MIISDKDRFRNVLIDELVGIVKSNMGPPLTRKQIACGIVNGFVKVNAFHLHDRRSFKAGLEKLYGSKTNLGRDALDVSYKEIVLEEWDFMGKKLQRGFYPQDAKIIESFRSRSHRERR